jgi:hypothetical protein
MEIGLSTIYAGEGVENGRVTRLIPRKGMETPNRSSIHALSSSAGLHD